MRLDNSDLYIESLVKPVKNLHEVKIKKIGFWVSAGRIVEVLEQKQGIYFRIFDKCNQKYGTLYPIDIESESHSIEEIEKHLSKSLLKIDDAGIVNFFKPLKICKIPIAQDKNLRIYLHCVNNELQWEYCDLKRKLHVSTPFQDNIIPYQFISDESKNVIYGLNSSLNNPEFYKSGECYWFMKNFYVTSVNFNRYQGVKESIKSVVFSPLFVPSRIDNRIIISSLYWGATILCHNGCKNNHAEILIEGINEGEYFMYWADFTGSIVRKDDHFETKKLEYEQRTHVYKASRQNIEKMITAIETDALNTPQFNILGSSSILNKNGGNNCITWARSMLAIAGINIGSNIIDKLVTITKNYTKPDASLKQMMPEQTSNWTKI